jgi:hypothetical protein
VYFEVFNTVDFYNLLGLTTILVCIFSLLTLVIFQSLKVDETLPGSVFFLLGWIPLFVLFANILCQFNNDLLYTLPFGIILLVNNYFYNQSLSFAIYLSALLIISLFLSTPAEWLFLQIFIGLLIIFLPFGSKKPLFIIGSVFIVNIASFILLGSLKLMNSSLGHSFGDLFFFSLYSNIFITCYLFNHSGFREIIFFYFFIFINGVGKFR